MFCALINAKAVVSKFSSRFRAYHSLSGSVCPEAAENVYTSLLQAGKILGRISIEAGRRNNCPFFNQLVSFIKFGNSAIGHLVAARFTDKADGISIRMQQGILTFKCPFLNSLQLPLHVYMHYLQRGGQDYICLLYTSRCV